MLKKYVKYLLVGLLISPSAFAATDTSIRLRVVGLEGKIEDNVRLQLLGINPNQKKADGRYRKQVDKAIRTGLRAMGYYDPKIKFEFHPAKDKKRPLLDVNVDPGEPVLIADSRVIINGEAKADPEYQMLLLSGCPEPGKQLNHGEYDDFKKSLTGLALRRGYFDADLQKSQLGVIPTKNLAFWDFEFNSGKRYSFGDVTFYGSHIRQSYIENLVPFEKNEKYSSDSLAEFNRRLGASNWFGSVVVVPDFKAVSKDKVLPLRAYLAPRKRNAVEVGVGYSTDVGPRGKLTWKKPWINSMGHSLEMSTSISEPEQIVDIAYKIPLMKNPLEEYYVIQGGYKREDQNDTESDSGNAAISRYWEMAKGWQKAIHLKWSNDHFVQGNVSGATMLLYPGVSINRSRTRGTSGMPTWGDSQRYSIDYSHTVWGSDVEFAIFQAQNVWIRTLFDKHRFVFRGHLGWIETNNFDRLPPSLRFFAGGDRSVRGYKYKGISPTDSSGKLSGASKLVTGSLEYQYNVTGKWWLAAFVDSGEAVNKIDKSDFKTGVGLGIRWASPIGPVKFDLAMPLEDGAKFRDIQFYIALGPEL